MKLSKVKIAIITSALIVTGGGFAIANIGNEPEVKSPVIKKEIKEEVTVPKEEPVVQESTVVPPVQPTPEPPKTVVPPTDENPYAQNTPMWYVYNKRKSAGKSVGNWGLARMWPSVAASQGSLVDSTPQSGDVMVIGDLVYFVESTSEATINVSTILDGQVRFIDMAMVNLNNRPNTRFIH